jgi:hypothetical protein
MKRRGLRVTLTAGAIGLAVGAVVVAFNWGVVRDHCEAWWFVWTHDAETLTPHPFKQDGPIRVTSMEGFVRLALQELANRSARPVVFDPAAMPAFDSRTSFIIEAESVSFLAPELGPNPVSSLRAAGYRIVDLRFPRWAYVVVEYPDPIVAPGPSGRWTTGGALQPLGN